VEDGEQAYRQEHGCAFSDSVTAVFDRDLVEGAITSPLFPLN
jgi:hypothetical protein